MEAAAQALAQAKAELAAAPEAAPAAAPAAGAAISGETASPRPLQPRGAAAGTLEARLRAFYLQLNPEKCDDAVKVARLFAGRESALDAKLRERYNEDLQSQGLGPPERSSSSSGRVAWNHMNVARLPLVTYHFSPFST